MQECQSMEKDNKHRKITCISDTHMQHEVMRLAPGDILVHCGDVTHRGDLSDLHKFCRWSENLPFNHKIIIAGNHDFCFENYHKNSAEGMLKEAGWIYLNNSSCVIDGIKFYGSPYTPFFHNWAFNLRGYDKLKACWDLIPDDTNVLLTHGPAHGILDYTTDGEHVGCSALLKRLANLKELDLHVAGHIHEGYGWCNNGQITHVNASLLDRNYRLKNAPYVIYVKKRRKL